MNSKSWTLFKPPHYGKLAAPLTVLFLAWVLSPWSPFRGSTAAPPVGTQPGVATPSTSVALQTDPHRADLAAVEAVIRRAEARLLEKRVDALVAVAREHVAQVDGWSFAATRHGAFLTLVVTRAANPPKVTPEDFHPGREFSTTVNMGRVPEVKLVPGHAPDDGGVVYYHAVPRTFVTPGVPRPEDEPLPASLPTDSPWLMGWAQGTDLVVRAFPPFVPSERPFYSPVPEPCVTTTTGQQTWCSSTASIVAYGAGMVPFPVTTKGWARPAEDDRIMFTGVGTLLVPAGLGQQVLDAVLKAVEDPPASARPGVPDPCVDLDAGIDPRCSSAVPR